MSVNTTAGVETNATPIAFTKRAMMGTDEYVVPTDVYNSVRYGRTKHERWNSFITHTDLADNIKSTLYGKGKCFVTDSMSGASVCIQHNRTPRSSLDVNESTVDYTQDVAELDDNEFAEYDEAFEYATQHLAFNEPQSDFFAQCVLCYMDIVHSLSDYEVSDEYLEQLINVAIDEVRQGSVELGMDDHQALDITQRLGEYIANTYDFEVV